MQICEKVFLTKGLMVLLGSVIGNFDIRFFVSTAYTKLIVAIGSFFKLHNCMPISKVDSLILPCVLMKTCTIQRL